MTRLFVKEGRRAFFVRDDSIRWIEAEDDLVILHVGERTYRVRATLSGIQERLDSQRFLRIHRSAIVNVDFIAELRIQSHGDYDVILRDGTILKLSRAFTGALQDLADSSIDLEERPELLQ